MVTKSYWASRSIKVDFVMLSTWYFLISEGICLTSSCSCVRCWEVMQEYWIIVNSYLALVPPPPYYYYYVIEGRLISIIVLSIIYTISLFQNIILIIVYPYFFIPYVYLVVSISPSNYIIAVHSVNIYVSIHYTRIDHEQE